MTIDTETRHSADTEPDTTAEGGLCRLELPGLPPAEEDELPEDELEHS